MSVKIRQTLTSAAHMLGQISDTPRLDVELLMAHALGVARDEMLMRHLDDMTPDDFAPLVARRMKHEPLAYITQKRDFWSITLTVTPAVLIPRPDSETLIEAAVTHFGQAGPAHVLDLGTGSGALLLAALAQWPGARGLGIDASEAALAVAAGNAAALGMADRATFQKGDWTEGLVPGTFPLYPEHTNSARATMPVPSQFDLILCNPPYVETTAQLAPDVARYEPASALYAGSDGLGDYHCIIPQLAPLIAPGGLIAVEIGMTQAAAVTAIFAQHGMAVTCANDLGARPRALLHFALGFDAQPA